MLPPFNIIQREFALKYHERWHNALVFLVFLPIFVLADMIGARPNHDLFPIVGELEENESVEFGP